MEPLAASTLAGPEGAETEVEECHLCYEHDRGVDREIRASMSRAVMEGRMVLVEMEQTEGDAPHCALRYMDQETHKFRTFAPARDAYITFAVAMKITQIASLTKKELHMETKMETAMGLDDSAVGAGNITRGLELYNMSEYNYTGDRTKRETVSSVASTTSSKRTTRIREACAERRRELQRTLKGGRDGLTRRTPA